MPRRAGSCLSCQTLGIGMSELNGLAQMGVVLNARYMGNWADMIGRFIVNFGGIELLSYQQLLLLEASHDDFTKNLDRLLSKRIERLVQLIKESNKLSEEECANAIDLWEEAKEFSKWRNRIAHNPVLPTWKAGSNPDTSPPDLLGIPDFKQLKDGNTSNSIPTELMTKMIDESAALAQRLHQVSVRLRADA
jgi:hypothetical protein